MARPTYPLFAGGELQATLDARRKTAKKFLFDLPRDQFIGTSVDTLVDHVVEKFSVHPLVIHEDQMRMDANETKVDVSGRMEYDLGMHQGSLHVQGHELLVFLPFSGEAGLWTQRPSVVVFGNSPRGQVDEQTSVLSFRLANTENTSRDWYQQQLEANLKLIRTLVASQASMIDPFNRAMPQEVRGWVGERRSQIDKMHGLVASIAIPLVKKAGMPEFRPIEMKKRIARPLPRVGPAGAKPEPAISDELYEELLGIIRHTGASFEGTPQTYVSNGEEGLRDGVLSHINVVFEGKATGETFRKYGKTDIRIEEETRSAFVAECKLWEGQKLLLDALDQLLGYLTWRDCKAALVIFNKTVAGFSTVQETIGKALPTHPNFLRAKDIAFAGEWRFVFRSQEDGGREVTVHVFAFDLYVTPTRAGKRR